MQHFTPIPANAKKFLTGAAVPLSLACVFFALQARFLPWAAMPDTDEGVYAQVGRLVAGGYLPHRDFAFYHMPLLPLLAGWGEAVFSLTAVRLAFLFLNAFAVVPMYFAFSRIKNDRFAAAVAVFAYLTYHEMVHHDFRFLAIRQLANDVFIAYVFLGTVGRTWKTSFLGQALLATASALLFLPSLANVGLASVALAWRAPSKRSRSEYGRYAVIGSIAVLAALAWLFLVPNAYQQVVLDQLHRPGEAKLQRLWQLRGFTKDYWFYAVTTGCLFAGLSHRSLRPFAAAMLGVVAASLFLSSNFYPHYLSVAGPAFAFGAFCGAALLRELLSHFGRGGLAIGAISTTLALAAHAGVVLPSLWAEWMGNHPREYADVVDALRETGGPVLAMQPIYAVQARVRMVDGLLPAYTRPPVGWPSFGADEYERMAAESCSILLDGSLKGALPGGVADAWLARYPKVLDNSWATVLRVPNPSCPR